PFGSLLGMTPYNDVRFGLLGGSIVDANALLRSYIWHCIGIPIVASVLMIVHFWRVRKDGGISGPAPVMLAEEADKPRRGPKAAGEEFGWVATAEAGRCQMVRGGLMDWRQLWEICSAPDNVPIVGLIPLLAFYIYLAWKQAHANDVLIAELEADPAMAKTHHRKTWPFKPGWAKEVHVWPFLLRIEFLAAIIITIILMVWSITLNAPLEEPANPNLTMNPAKAPWYFLGLQEMLVYFDPWIAGVVMPTMIIIGLMVIPYIDTNPLGSGYYTWKQRKFSISTFLFGFIILWVAMIIIGTFIRGPGWQWFWPGQTWDHNRLIYEVNRDLP